MFRHLNIKYLSIYWLSEFADRFEVWMAKKASLSHTPDSLSFAAYLVWPVEEADEAHMIIKREDNTLVLLTDWFPEEEFPLKVFTSQDQEMILMSHYERETIFIHLEK